MTTLIDLVPASDLHRRIAAIVDRYAYGSGTNGPAATAARILGDPQIAAGLAALPVLVALREQHQPRRWAADSDATTCSCGNGRCDVGQVLAGC